MPVPLTPAQTPVLLPTKPLPEVQRGDVLDYTISPMRIHEVALQRWLYDNFFVMAGYPIPVVFSTPMDAFAEFQRLWQGKGEKNPFKFLLDAKDVNGNALYEPYPANIRYPLISVARTGFVYRTTQSYGIHRFRRISYLSVSGSNPCSPIPLYGSHLRRRDLANVAQSEMPTAWDFKYQIDHYCTRPDTQATFIHSMMRALSRSGGNPQTWIRAIYPGFYGSQVLRLYLDGTIDSITNMEPGDAQMEYRTSLSITIEGYSPDIDITVVPALWQIVIGTDPLSPADLLRLEAGQTPLEDANDIRVYDLRGSSTNPVFNFLPNLPPVQ